MIQDEMEQWWIHHKEKVPIFGVDDNTMVEAEDIEGKVGGQN